MSNNETETSNAASGRLNAIVMCDQCGWSGDENDRIDLFCPECGSHVECRKIIEIRVHSKFGGSHVDCTVSIIFDDGTCTYFKEQFHEWGEAEAFASGIKHGFSLRNAGIRIDT